MGAKQLLNPRALTKIQSIILIAIVVVAAIGGVAVYVLDGGKEQSSETIKIGVCADLDNFYGKTVLQGARLAAEQVNAEGGVLGKNFEIVSEDDDGESGNLDMSVAINAMTRLITVDEADFIISTFFGMYYREIAFEHEKIFFTANDPNIPLTQGVLDNYDRYKYYFRGGGGNMTANVEFIADAVVACRDHTGFNKIAVIYLSAVEDLVSLTVTALEEEGFDVVLSEAVGFNVMDFSSLFAKAEAAGAEIFASFIFGTAGIQLIKEYYDRQSPMIMMGGSGGSSDFWEITDGKCEHIIGSGYSIVAGYPLTSKTLPTRDAYVEKWNEPITSQAASVYDVVRFILPDAIDRAGTIETEAVIKALEETDIETSLARHFIFTPSHDILSVEGPEEKEFFFSAAFQWQNGFLVPVYPIELMEEAGATITFPDWPGPWDGLD
jgi:branched-chain amino acid transport system substrate-binding protein